VQKKNTRKQTTKLVIISNRLVFGGFLMRIELEKPRRYAMFPKGYAALELSKEESEAIASDIESYLYKKGIIVDNITIKG